MKKYYSKNNLISDETPATQIEKNTSERRRKNMKTLFDNTTILPFRWRGAYICFYCSTEIHDYVEFRNHTKSHGKCSIKNTAMKKLKGNGLAINVDVSEIACELCEQQFKSLEVVVEHLLNEHGLNYDKEIYSEILEYRLIDLRCTQCDMQFEAFKPLASHLNKYHPLNSYICHHCGRNFNKKRDIMSHINSYHRLGGYICKQCGFECKSRSDLRKHTAHTHLTRCHVCGVKFMYLNKLFKHVELEHPNDNNKSCGYCMKEFHTTVGLKQHLMKCKVRLLSLDETENATITESKNSVNTSRTHEQIVRIRENIQCVLNMSTAIPFRFRVKFSCFYCSQKYDDYEVLKQHTQTEHPVCDIKSKSMKKCKGKRTFVRVDIANLACKLCSAPMPDLEHFIDHSISVHDANYDKTVSIETCFEPYRLLKGNIPCLECPKVFRYLNTMLRHFNSEHSNNNVICDYCGRGFRSTTNLKMHLQNTHTGSCECKICHAKFKNQSVLVRHMAKNHNEKTFKCANCSEMFESAYQRQIHLIKVHGIGHKCEYCGKMFTKHSFMDSHVRRTHLKEKNVTCSVCNDKFFDNHLLRMHMVKHDGERKFKCELCGKAFLRQKNLRTHMDTHKKYGFVQ